MWPRKKRAAEPAAEFNADAVRSLVGPGKVAEGERLARERWGMTRMLIGEIEEGIRRAANRGEQQYWKSTLGYHDAFKQSDTLDHLVGHFRDRGFGVEVSTPDQAIPWHSFTITW